MPSAHSDTFARDRLPAPELQPEFLFELPELTFPEQMNCATELLDRHVIEGRGDRVCVRAPGLTWTYRARRPTFATDGIIPVTPICATPTVTFTTTRAPTT